MSENPTKKTSPRAMPVETIVTRSQQRQKLKNVRKTKPTKFKAKPVKQYGWKPKRMKPVKECQQSHVTELNDCREFYPEKLRRNIEIKKVVLKPKHCMKMIGGTKSTNKRKLHIPQKDIKRVRHNSNSSTLSEIDPYILKNKDQSTELSVKDMVLLIEEKGGLDDEDLLEILTCPSPVWWEDPPPGYIEDPIFARSKPAEQKSIKKQLLEEQNKEAERRKERVKESTMESKDSDNLDVSKLGINVQNRGINFVKKRCKLESLLGNIRNKLEEDSIEEKNVNKDLNTMTNKNYNNDDHDINENNISVTNTKDIEKKSDRTELNANTIEKCKKNHNNTNKNRKVKLKPKISQTNIINETNELSAAPQNIKKLNKKKVAIIKDCIQLDESKNKDQSVESKPKRDKNNKKNINNLAKCNREMSSSESFEDDSMLLLEDHEILSLENIEIPIAPTKITKPIKIKKSGTSTLENIDYQSTAYKIKSTIINNALFHGNLETKPFSYNTEKEETCSENEVEKHISDEIIKYIDTTPKQLKNKVSYVRVRKIESLKHLNNSTNDIMSGEINLKNASATENESSTSGNKNVCRSNDDKTVETSNDNFSSSDKTEISNDVSEIEDVCNVMTAITKESLSHPKITVQTVTLDNNHLKNVNDIRDHVNEKPYIETKSEFVDLTELDNTSIPNKNVSRDHWSAYNVQIEKKISKNHDIGNNINVMSVHTDEIGKLRRYSIDSTISDKNMSVEYLDMNLLDEDEHKPESDNYNNELNNEFADNTQALNQSVRKNSLDRRHLTKDITDIERFNHDRMMHKSFRSSSPIHQKKSTLNELSLAKPDFDDKQQSEYVAVYKVLTKNTDNVLNIKKSNEIKVNNKGNFMIKKEIEDSESINYDVEYLTEFDDDIDIEGFKNEDGKLVKINEVTDMALNINHELNLVNLNNIENSINEVKDSIKNKKIKLNEVESSADKCNENINNPDASTKNDKVNREIKHRKHIRSNIITSNKKKHGRVKKKNCKSCSFKNESILISENDTIKYCLLCSSIYDTDRCKYCIKRLNEKCSCDDANEYVCDKCSVRVGNKNNIIEHLKECMVGG